ncbi:hypothetical protein GGI21_004866, partial [Coemansia aciculifera]
ISPRLHRAPLLCGRRNAKALPIDRMFILGIGKMPSILSQLGKTASPCGVLAAAIHDRTRRNVLAGHMAVAQPVVSSAVQSPISDSGADIDGLVGI